MKARIISADGIFSTDVELDRAFENIRGLIPQTGQQRIYKCTRIEDGVRIYEEQINAEVQTKLC